jgi:hypothetical protein
LTELGEFDPFSMNNRGDIAGIRIRAGDELAVDPLLYQPGKGMTILPRPRSKPIGIAFGISNDGRCVGVVGDLDSDIKAALWEGGKLRLLSERLSFAYGVNSRGQVVGIAQRSRNGEAVLWSGNQEVFLKDVLSGSGGDLILASSINEQGQIGGTGILGDTLFGYVLTPEPK